MMFLPIKIGQGNTRTYQVMRRRYKPEVGDEFTVRGIGEFDWEDIRVRCTGIVGRFVGGPLYYVEII